jgi:hypothetical protein
MGLIPPLDSFEGQINLSAPSGSEYTIWFVAPAATGAFKIRVGAADSTGKFSHTDLTGLWDTMLDKVAITIPGPSWQVWFELTGYVIDLSKPWAPNHWVIAGSYEMFARLLGLPPGPHTLLRITGGGWLAQFGFGALPNDWPY